LSKNNHVEKEKIKVKEKGVEQGKGRKKRANLSPWSLLKVNAQERLWLQSINLVESVGTDLSRSQHV